LELVELPELALAELRLTLDGRLVHPDEATQEALVDRRASVAALGLPTHRGRVTL